jgi:DNA-binding transcriptional regulator YiaG
LRVALESIRQALVAIAEREPVADDHTPKEIVQWLADRTEVPQARLAELLGVSARQLQRWLSSTETAQPEGDDVRKVRLVARNVNQLGNRTPLDLLPDVTQEAALVAIAGSMRASHAA